MYSDPARHSYMFQSYVQLTMMDNHTVHCEEPVKMMERSIHSGRWVQQHCADVFQYLRLLNMIGRVGIGSLVVSSISAIM